MIKHTDTLYLLLASLALTMSAHAQEREFDVDSEKVAAIYHRDLSPNTEISCHLEVTQTRFSGDWGPSFSVILSDSKDVMSQTDEASSVRLTLAIAESSGDRLYSLVTDRGAKAFDSPFLGLTGKPKGIVLVLGFRDDGVFAYFASEGMQNFGQGHVIEPSLKPRYAVVVASGMAGTVKCGSSSI